MVHDDLELFDRWSGGDVHAGQRLVSRHYEAVYFFFVSRLPDHDAVALTQATFEAMCARAESLRLHSSFVSYLLGIARGMLVEFLGRRMRRRFDPVTESYAGFEASPSITAALGGERRSSRLVSALRTLPLDDQLVLELQTYPSLRLREMAEILGVPSNRIATRLATAKRRLRRMTQQLPQEADTFTTLSTTMKSLHEEFLRQVRARGLRGDVAP